MQYNSFDPRAYDHTGAYRPDEHETFLQVEGQNIGTAICIANRLGGNQARGVMECMAKITNVLDASADSHNDCRDVATEYGAAYKLPVEAVAMLDAAGPALALRDALQLYLWQVQANKNERNLKMAVQFIQGLVAANIEQMNVQEEEAKGAAASGANG